MGGEVVDHEFAQVLRIGRRHPDQVVGDPGQMEHHQHAREPSHRVGEVIERAREANRFNPAGRGAWYAGFEVQTAIAEVRFHITRALRDAGSYEAVVEWSEMWASMAGEFVDLRAVQPRAYKRTTLPGEPLTWPSAPT